MDLKPKKYKIRQMGTETGEVLWWAGGYWSGNVGSAMIYSEGDSFTIFNQMKRDGVFVRRVNIKDIK